MISKFQAGLKSLLRQGLSEPDFYGDLVYKLKKIVGFNNFSAQFIEIISHYKKIGYNINVFATVRVCAQLGFEPRGWVCTELAGCRVTASAAVAKWPLQSKRCLLRFGDRSYLYSVVISAAKYQALF